MDVTAGSLAALRGDDDRARAPARRRSARQGRRSRGGHARRWNPHACHPGGDLHARAGVRRRPARPRARGRPSDQPVGRHDPRPGRATRPPSRPACGPWRGAIRACGSATARRWPRVTDADRETNRWLGPLFVALIFAFSSIAVVNTLAMIALQRGRELALLRLVGGTRGQVRAMARWEAGLIIAMGLGVGLAIAATALLPLSHALTGSLRPTSHPASSPRSSAAPRCSRCWPWRSRRAGRCAPGRSRRSVWANSAARNG